MAEPADRSGGNGFIYFVIGALVVAVAVIAWIALANGGGRDTAEINLEVPEVDAPDIDLPEPDTPDVEVDID